MFADRALHSSSESQPRENLPRCARAVELRFGDGEPFAPLWRPSHLVPTHAKPPLERVG